jgi:2-polyprenyl-3-methyl-5-hydroxy-6-metoxy-1,4-benzoquinol methylase
MDDTSDIRQFYDAAAEKENTRLERHQVERDMTWRYLDKYLPRRGRILEVGCATGAYTIPLAKRGYFVTAVDFSSTELELCKKHTKTEKQEEKINCVLADARDLSDITGSNFDAALMMGPLYHLLLEEDRLTALRQAHRHLKKGGLIFSTFISRYGIWNDVIRDIPHYIDNKVDAESTLKYGRDAQTAEGGFRGYFATAEEIPPLHEKAGFKTLALAGIETAGMRDDIYASVSGRRQQMWLDLLFSISTQPSIIGASNHILYVGVKEG